VDVGAVYAIGDSVMIDIQPALSRDIAGVTVNGKVSRQFATGVQIIASLRAAGRLPPTVIVELGTNGTVTAPRFDAMMAAAQGAERVVFCTVHVPRSWEAGDNAVIRAGVARYSNTRLADWAALSQGHPEWFAPDGYHLTVTGARALAALIASVV
jgi:lysophospholipase L1-like esterase